MILCKFSQRNEFKMACLLAMVFPPTLKFWVDAWENEKAEDTESEMETATTKSLIRRKFERWTKLSNVNSVRAHSDLCVCVRVCLSRDDQSFRAYRSECSYARPPKNCIEVVSRRHRQHHHHRCHRRHPRNTSCARHKIDVENLHMQNIVCIGVTIVRTMHSHVCAYVFYIAKIESRLSNTKTVNLRLARKTAKLSLAVSWRSSLSTYV